MIKSLVTTFSLVLFSLAIHAQQENEFCGTRVPTDAWENEFQKVILDYKIKQLNKKKSSTSYTIPIIFHVIHSGQPIGTFPNISQGQINAQITVLNQDFSGNGYNSSNYPTNAFSNWAINQSLPIANIDANGRVKIADVGIQFCLATKDTLGNILPEQGIDRIDLSLKGWADPSSFTNQTTLRNFIDNTVKPQSIWNVTKYLNIWVTDKSSALMYTGFATLPPLSTLSGISAAGTDTTDGIWCYAKAVGSNLLFPSGIYAASTVSGRTITHEAGHYLGLRHIWGDAACATDHCDDTPPASAQNTGNPSYPLKVGSCSNPSNTPDGEMFMNFMDYSADPFKYMFTTDQATRVQTAMINSPFRNQLGTHGLCSAPLGINDVNMYNTISIYPNPAKTELNLNVSQNDINEVSISNLLGQVLIKFQNQNRIDISNLNQGIYVITITQGQNKLTQKLIKEQ